ncbi:Vsb1 protein [Saccharomycopsis crataegensis]|uniref:Vsb1 protein n=1 Tax=Saccharomycopsis crataegensis TaxID=43959 RepID=A0AAV5QR69_9ASCO|nr:Vsb1 protein [Saccharomycopsis crataegensis]
MSYRGSSDFSRSGHVLGTTPVAIDPNLSSTNHDSPAAADEATPLINSELQVHQKTAELSTIDFENSQNGPIDDGALFLDDDSGNFNYNPYYYQQQQPAITSPSQPLFNPLNNTTYGTMDETRPQDLESFNALLGNPSNEDHFENTETRSVSSIINFTRKLNRSVSSKLLNIHGPTNPQDEPFGASSSSSSPSNSIKDRLLDPLSALAVESMNLLPCVFLGLLLNVLDALSYGMIVFPINQPLFADLGPSGLSMFYVSCIISQLVYSLGGSSFRSAIGSEMIEVTPFFHSMAINIMNSIGTDSSFKNKDAIVATTIVCYCTSTLLTGLVFFLLGKFKLGQLIGFFPRHILIGSIGGVGYFLVVTGIEITSRLDTTFAYNWPTFVFLFQGVTFIKWFSAILITVLLILMQKFSKRLASFSLLLPVYFMAIFGLIHFFIWIVPGWDLQMARDNGFIFDIKAPVMMESVGSAVSTVASSENESWYHFWTLYKFSKVHWSLIASQFPSMLALTFFGMLHVPINVPALAISTNHDNVDLDRELLAHGYSNFLSGLVGSIQNYLVYSNSLLFIRSGAGDSRLAGILLAATTAIVMFIGPVLIKFIPVCVVGSLIFLLGYELMKESLYDSYSKLSTFDYVTIIVIIVTMGLVDFVYGILLGVLIAFISFVVENANQNPVKKVFTGEVVRSTIKRNTLTNSFLKNVGSQTLIVKLQGNIFFGSIGSIEREIRQRFTDNQSEQYGFRYLILDLGSVLSVDYTAAEGFQNIKNFTVKNNCYLILSSISSDGIFESLLNVGVLEEQTCNSTTQLFHDLNSALEWCENEYLTTLYNMKQRRGSKSTRSGSQASQIANYGALNASSRIPSQQHQKSANPPPQPITMTSSSLQIPGGGNNYHQQEEYKYNLTESYLNPMSLMKNPNGFGSPRQRNIIRAITKSVDEQNDFSRNEFGHNVPQIFDDSSNLSDAIAQTINSESQLKPPSNGDLDSSMKRKASGSLNGFNEQEYQLVSLLRKTFQGASARPDAFWKPLLPYLKPVSIPRGKIYDPAAPVSESLSNDRTNEDGDDDSVGHFFILESGLIQMSYDFNSRGKVSETLVPKTCFGSLGIKSASVAKRMKNVRITALKDSKIWKLSHESFSKLCNGAKTKDVANELLLVEVNLLSERFDKITGYILISS